MPRRLLSRSEPACCCCMLKNFSWNFMNNSLLNGVIIRFIASWSGFAGIISISFLLLIIASVDDSSSDISEALLLMLDPLPLFSPFSNFMLWKWFMWWGALECFLRWRNMLCFRVNFRKQTSQLKGLSPLKRIKYWSKFLYLQMNRMLTCEFSCGDVNLRSTRIVSSRKRRWLCGWRSRDIFPFCLRVLHRQAMLERHPQFRVEPLTSEQRSLERVSTWCAPSSWRGQRTSRRRDDIWKGDRLTWLALLSSENCFLAWWLAFEALLRDWTVRLASMVPRMLTIVDGSV